MEALQSGTPVIVITMGIVILLLVVILALMGWSVRIDKSGLATEKVDRVKKRLSHHSRCPHKLEGVNACRKSYEFGYRRGTSSSMTLAQQMCIYDEIEEEAVSAAQTRFVDLLRDKDQSISHYTLCPEYLQFETLLLAIFSDIRRMVRRWFKNNHYALKDATEQSEYIRCKKILLIQKAWKMIDCWWAGNTVTTADMAKQFEDDKEVWKDRIDSLFTQAFEIARANNEIRESAEKHYCQYIEDTFGTSISIVDDSTVI